MLVKTSPNRYMSKYRKGTVTGILNLQAVSVEGIPQNARDLCHLLQVVGDPVKVEVATSSDNGMCLPVVDDEDDHSTYGDSDQLSRGDGEEDQWVIAETVEEVSLLYPHFGETTRYIITLC